MYNLNHHNNFKYLKEYLAKFDAITFEEFIEQSKTCAKVISESISEMNMDVYGYNYYQKPYYPNDIPLLKTHIANKVIGDIFEIFAGFFMQYFDSGFPFSIRKGTYTFCGDMKASLDETDLGMDGFGTFSSTNDNAIVQVKFRSNPNDKPFNKNVFMSLFGEGIIKEKIQYGNVNQRLIFITNIPIGDDNSWDGKTKQFNDLCHACKNPVVRIGYNEIIPLVGSNKTFNTNTDFWSTFYSQFKEENKQDKNLISW